MALIWNYLAMAVSEKCHIAVIITQNVVENYINGN